MTTTNAKKFLKDYKTKLDIDEGLSLAEQSALKDMFERTLRQSEGRSIIARARELGHDNIAEEMELDFDELQIKDI